MAEQTDWHERGCSRGCRDEHTKVWGWCDLAEESKPPLDLQIFETWTAEDGVVSAGFRPVTMFEAHSLIWKYIADRPELARIGFWRVVDGEVWGRDATGWHRYPNPQTEFYRSCDARYHVPGERGMKCRTRCGSWRLFWNGIERCEHAACHDPGGKWRSGRRRIWHVRSFWRHDDV